MMYVFRTAANHRAITLLKVDVKNVSCRVKQLPLMNMAEGNLLFIQAPTLFIK